MTLVRLPLRARLALLSSALIACVLVVFGTFLYVRLSAGLLETVDSGLRSRAAELVGSGADLRIDGAGLAEPEEAFAQLLGADGRVIESSIEIPALLTPEVLADLRAATTFDRVVPVEGERVPARLLAVSAPGDLVVVVGTSLEDQHEAQTDLLVLLLVGGPIAALLGGGVGWLVAGAALRPVDRMRADAEAISSSEPGRRLQALPPSDELGRLAESLNRMLSRLQDAAQRERRFVDDASHELRTPLTNLRAELELALRRDRDPAALHAALQSAGEETERLVRLAEDMLVLARADHGPLIVRRDDTDVSELVQQVISTFGRPAAERDIKIHLPVAAAVRAPVDPARLGQAIGNLVSNALRHAPTGGRVELGLRVAPGEIEITVSDNGPGFPPELLPSAFEPFTRSDHGRARADGGTGLGLAIVKAVAAAHGGSVEAKNLPSGGAVVTIRIPG